jgi:hypothetical protein
MRTIGVWKDAGQARQIAGAVVRRVDPEQAPDRLDLRGHRI